MRALPFLPKRLTGRLRRIGLDERGIAAVEFALILPVMLVLFLGLSELQPGISIKRKVGVVARTLADLSGRAATLSSAELKTIFGAATAIMRPYDATKTQMVVTLVKVTKKSEGVYEGSVLWSCPWNLPSTPVAGDLKKRATTEKPTVPPAFANDSTASYIQAETLYPYKPTIGTFISDKRNITELMTWPVRDAATVTLSSCPTP